jgi:hypothetical protein
MDAKVVTESELKSISRYPRTRDSRGSPTRRIAKEQKRFLKEAHFENPLFYSQR